MGVLWCPGSTLAAPELGSSSSKSCSTANLAFIWIPKVWFNSLVLLTMSEILSVRNSTWSSGKHSGAGLSIRVGTRLLISAMACSDLSCILFKSFLSFSTVTAAPLDTEAVSGSAALILEGIWTVALYP